MAVCARYGREGEEEEKRTIVLRVLELFALSAYVRVYGPTFDGRDKIAGQFANFFGRV